MADNKDAPICVICLDTVDEKESYALECRHTFHRPCIQGWFQTQLQQHHSLTCPTCRQSPSASPNANHSSLTPEQTRRLIMDGILSLPLLLEWTYFPNESIRLRRVLTQLRPQIQRFHTDPDYSLLRLSILIGTALALDKFTQN